MLVSQEEILASGFHFPLPFSGAKSSSDGKVSAYNVGGVGSIPGSGRSPGEGNGNPLQYSCLENPMDRGAWWATVPGVTKSRSQQSDFISTSTSLFRGCHHWFWGTSLEAGLMSRVLYLGPWRVTQTCPQRQSGQEGCSSHRKEAEDQTDKGLSDKPACPASPGAPSPLDSRY